MFKKRRFLNELLEKKLISEQQFKEIAKTYSIKDNDSSTNILLYIASLFLSLALIFFIAYNWEDLSRAVKTTFLLAFLLLTQFLSFYLKKDSLKQIFAFLSSFVLLACIGLLSQLYHLGDNASLAFLVVAFSAFFLSAVLNSFYIFLQSYILAFISFYIYSVEYLSTSYIYVFFLFFAFLIQFMNDSKFLALLNYLFLSSFIAMLTYVPTYINTVAYLAVDSFLNSSISYTIFISLFFLLYNLKNYHNLSYFFLILALVLKSFSELYSYSLGEGLSPYFSSFDFFLRLLNPFESLFTFLIFCGLVLCLYRRRYFFALLAVLLHFEIFIVALLEVEFLQDAYYYFLLTFLGIYLVKNNKLYMGFFSIFVMVICLLLELYKTSILATAISFAVLAVFTFCAVFFMKGFGRKNEK